MLVILEAIEQKTWIFLEDSNGGYQFIEKELKNKVQNMEREFKEFSYDQTKKSFNQLNEEYIESH